MKTIVKEIKVILLAILVGIALTACGGGGSSGGGGGGGTNNSVITSGTAVATSKPPSTQSGDSPQVTLISYNNTISPGGTLAGTIDFNDINGDVDDLIVSETGANVHNVITITSVIGITNGTINFQLNLTNGLSQQSSVMLDIGLRDQQGNVSNYSQVEIIISDDSIYSLTAYSGGTPPNISGTWDVRAVVKVGNPDIFVGQVFNTSVTITQSGSNVTLTDNNGQYYGTIRGAGSNFTLTYVGTFDFNPQANLYADFWANMSGRFVNINQIGGESNGVITDIYGADSTLYRVYSLSSNITMTKSGSGGAVWEDFESYSAGSFPSAWTPDANANANDNTTNYVDSSVSYMGSNSLRLYGTVGGCLASLTTRPLTVSPPYEVELAIRNGTEVLSGCHPSRASIALLNGTSWTNPGRGLLTVNEDGTLTSASGNLNLGSIGLLTWHKIKIRYERPTSSATKITYWIDGVLKGTETLATLAQEDQMTNLQLGAQEGTVWFDEISLLQLP